MLSRTFRQNFAGTRYSQVSMTKLFCVAGLQFYPCAIGMLNLGDLLPPADTPFCYLSLLLREKAVQVVRDSNGAFYILFFDELGAIAGGNRDRERYPRGPYRKVPLCLS